MNEEHIADIFGMTPSEYEERCELKSLVAAQEADNWMHQAAGWTDR